jgi:hypothetical protein
MLSRDDIAAADWKDTEGLLDSIALLLEPHGLRLVQHDCGDDNYWVTVTPMSEPAPTAEDVQAAFRDEEEVDIS